MVGPDQLSIVYPESVNVFYRDLAWRLATACKENSQEVALYSSREICDTSIDGLGEATLAIVNPFECVHRIDDRPEFFKKVSTAHKRIMILAEAVETRWYGQQLRLPIEFDAFFDVGFVSQEDNLPTRDLPYHFVFNGPTRREEQIIAKVSPTQRWIPWAIVGHQTVDRLRLATELMDELDPRGFVFLPNRRPVREGDGMLGPSGLASVLSKTSYYVWSSHHDFAYYESFRFIDALLAGAVPCKIDNKTAQEWSDIPGIFPTFKSFCAAVQNEDFWSLYCSAREFYLSKDSLAVHLEGALRLV